jgi:release factor glutamine methyltransferase
MNIVDLKKYFQNTLIGYYPMNEINALFYLTSEHFLKMSRVAMSINTQALVDNEIFELYESTLVRLKNYEPIQYILGSVSFCGLNFKVTPATLIPRPETAELIDWISSQLETNSTAKVMDVCTGSGCIAIVLANRFKELNIAALELSKPALQVAQENAALHQTHIDWINADIFDFKSDKFYDFIIANPPYVQLSERDKMQPNVLDFEPHQALFVTDEDPLLFYRAIAKLALNNLKNGGQLYFEINESLGIETQNLLLDLGFKNPVIKKDVFNKDRFLKVNKIF